MFLSNLFREPKVRTDGRSIYEAAVLQARTPTFYADHGVPDTVDGRFDMVILHVWIVLRHFRTAPDHQQDQREKVGQAIFDEMIRDLDRNVRQIGISDVRVGKQMKAMAKAFYGRIAAYDEALSNSDLATALKRNVFGKVDVADDEADKEAKFLEAYVQKQVDFLATQRFDDLFEGKIVFQGEISEKSR